MPNGGPGCRYASVGAPAGRIYSKELGGNSSGPFVPQQVTEPFVLSPQEQTPASTCVNLPEGGVTSPLAICPSRPRALVRKAQA